MNKTIVSIWIDKEASLNLQVREAEEHAAYKYTLKMQENNHDVKSDITMSQEGLDLMVKTLVSHNEKDVNLFSVYCDDETGTIKDTTVFHYFTKEKAEEKLLELQEEYPTDSVYIIESTVE